MPDTSEMTPAEYAAYTGKMSYPAGAAKAARILDQYCLRCEKPSTKALNGHFFCDDHFPLAQLDYSADQIDKSNQGQFESGQQVWSKASKTKYIVLDHFTNGLWQNGLWLIDLQATRVARLHDASDFTATDPNQPAESAPQKCPSCSAIPNLVETRSDTFAVECFCGMRSPMRDNRTEAIQAWNKISLDEPARPDDNSPLTEEWLREVGLSKGLKVKCDDTVYVNLTNCDDHKGEVEVEFQHDGDDEKRCVWTDGLKTIDDARTLCRLLGVPLKE